MCASWRRRHDGHVPPHRPCRNYGLMSVIALVNVLTVRSLAPGDHPWDRPLVSVLIPARNEERRSASRCRRWRSRTTATSRSSFWMTIRTTPRSRSPLSGLRATGASGSSTGRPSRKGGSARISRAISSRERHGDSSSCSSTPTRCTRATASVRAWRSCNDRGRPPDRDPAPADGDLLGAHAAAPAALRDVRLPPPAPRQPCARRTAAHRQRTVHALEARGVPGRRRP